eukprot:588955-Prorocentrum_minimum.AAC.1
MQEDYGMAAPVSVLNENGESVFGVNDWAMELTGYIHAPFSGEYTFTITADDVVRLWINTGGFSVDTEYRTTAGDHIRNRDGP